MRKKELISLLVLACVVATGAAWLWALPPLLTPLSYLHSTDCTEADLVRLIWPYRLVQPEWASTPPNYMRWSQAETLARLLVVVFGWLATTACLVKRYVREQTGVWPHGGWMLDMSRFTQPFKFPKRVWLVTSTAAFLYLVFYEVIGLPGKFPAGFTTWRALTGGEVDEIGLGAFATVFLTVFSLACGAFVATVCGILRQLVSKAG